MTKSNVIVLLALLVSAAPPTAGAEPRGRESSTQIERTDGDSREPGGHDRSSTMRMEVGGGLGTVGSWWSGPFNGGDLRVGFPIGDRGAIEALVGYSPHGADREAPIGLYARSSDTIFTAIRRVRSMHFSPTA